MQNKEYRNMNMLVDVCFLTQKLCLILRKKKGDIVTSDPSTFRPDS